MSDRTPTTAAALRHRDEYTPRVVRSPAEWDAFVGSLALIEAEARASQAEYDFVSGPGIPPHQCAPLDVERLARALQRVIDNGDALALFREDAEAIAREYAREEPTP